MNLPWRRKRVEEPFPSRALWVRDNRSLKNYTDIAQMPDPPESELFQDAVDEILERREKAREQLRAKTGRALDSHRWVIALRNEEIKGLSYLSTLKSFFDNEDEGIFELAENIDKNVMRIMDFSAEDRQWLGEELLRTHLSLVNAHMRHIADFGDENEYDRTMDLIREYDWLYHLLLGHSAWKIFEEPIHTLDEILDIRANRALIREGRRVRAVLAGWQKGPRRVRVTIEGA